MPYDKTTQKDYGENPMKEHGSPFEMRAKGYNNSPMQKNFGPDLALNKKLDKGSGTGKIGQPGGPITKKIGVTSKLEKSNMEGGMTGRTGLGELDGPLAFKWPGGAKLKKDVSALSDKVQTAGKTAGGNIKKGISNFASKIGLKKTGNIGDKLRGKYGGTKSKTKAKTSTTSNLNTPFKPSALSPSKLTTGLNLKKTKGGLYNPSSGSGSGSGSVSFGGAFKTARKTHGGDGGTFDWKGKKYSTNVKKKNKVVTNKNPVKPVVPKKTKTTSTSKTTLKKFGTPGWPSMTGKI